MSMRNSFLRHLALITLLTATLSACEDAPARDARNDPSPSIWAGQALLDDLDIATSLNMLKPDWTPFLGGQLPPRPLRQVISWDSTPHQSPAAGHFLGLDSPPKPCRRPFFRTRLATKALPQAISCGSTPPLGLRHRNSPHATPPIGAVTPEFAARDSPLWGYDTGIRGPLINTV